MREKKEIQTKWLYIFWQPVEHMMTWNESMNEMQWKMRDNDGVDGDGGEVMDEMRGWGWMRWSGTVKTSTSSSWAPPSS